MSFGRKKKRGRGEVREAPPAARSDVPDDVVPGPDLTVNDVGEPPWEESPAERRAWRQELVRSELALLFTLIFIGTVAYACWAATTRHWPAAKELVEILLPAETALIGSATGFYFGSRSRGDRSRA